jgi:predicted nucleic acid-binding protein
VWLGIINEEPDKVDSARWMIERAERGEVEIWTSTITLAEVYKVRRADGTVDPDGDRKLDAFLAQPYIVHVQVDQDVAMEARRLLRAGLPALRKPNDAIHLASAVWHDIEAFHTFDREDLLRLNGLVNCRNGKPLTIGKPPDRPPAPPRPPSLFDLAGPEEPTPGANPGGSKPPETGRT